MNINKKTIALVSALALVPNTYGMWPSMDFARNAVAGIAEYASAAQPAVNTAWSKAWSKIKENKGYIGAAATAAGLVYGGFKAYRYYTAPAVTAQAELDQATALLDGAVMREASIINAHQQDNSTNEQPQVDAIKHVLEKVIAAVVKSQVDLQHSASANSLSSDSTVEADEAVQAPVTEYSVTTTTCGNTLKVVKNPETGIAEFCLVDQSGQLKNRDREILFIDATKRAIAKDKHYVIENNKAGQVTIKVTNISGDTLDMRENIFRD
jgi:hypothetical protein